MRHVEPTRNPIEASAEMIQDSTDSLAFLFRSKKSADTAIRQSQEAIRTAQETIAFAERALRRWALPAGESPSPSQDREKRSGSNNC